MYSLLLGELKAWLDFLLLMIKYDRKNIIGVYAIF